MARVAVQSDSCQNKVAKLVYKSRGPYVVVNDTGLGSYACRKYGKPQGTLSKFLTDDLYLLPPQLLPCNEVDMADLRYFNSEFTPSLKHPFFKDFSIEAYNTVWFDDELDTSEPNVIITDDTNIESVMNTDDDLITPPPISQDPKTTATPAINPSTMSTETLVNSIEDNQIVELPTPHTGPTTVDNLHLMLAASEDYLFFIQYAPAGTLRRQWFLIQVNMEKSLDTANKGTYFCEVLGKNRKS